jgi:hypothetical protein
LKARGSPPDVSGGVEDQSAALHQARRPSVAGVARSLPGSRSTAAPVGPSCVRIYCHSEQPLGIEPWQDAGGLSRCDRLRREPASELRCMGSRKVMGLEHTHERSIGLRV